MLKRWIVTAMVGFRWSGRRLRAQEQNAFEKTFRLRPHLRRNFEQAGALSGRDHVSPTGRISPKPCKPIVSRAGEPMDAAENRKGRSHAGAHGLV